jgi:hypothetical protein
MKSRLSALKDFASMLKNESLILCRALGPAQNICKKNLAKCTAFYVIYSKERCGT